MLKFAALQNRDLNPFSPFWLCLKWRYAQLKRGDNDFKCYGRFYSLNLF